MYKVILVPAGCCQSALDVSLIEKNANAMNDKGYELLQVYQSSSSGCAGAKTSAVMIFKLRA